MDPDDMWDEHPVLTIFTKAEMQQLGMLELANAQRPSLTNAIHPIFGQSSWVNVRVAHHIQLRPVLRLASHFITDPQLLPYWHAQIFGQRFDIPRNIVVGPVYGHTLSYFQRTYDMVNHSFALNNLDLVRTRDALVSLAGGITFTITRGPSQSGAVLSTVRNYDSASPTSFPGNASLIEIDRKYLDAYAKPEVTVSQRLRLQFFLATCLVHELAHAVENAITPMLPRSPNRHGPKNWRDRHNPEEPFFERDRLAECGNAWENTVLGGIQSIFDSEIARYGVSTRKWPTKLNPGKGVHIPVRGKPKKWTTIYFVPMSHIQRLFTDEFWSHEGIGRHGAQELKSKKTHGWRSYNKGEVTSDFDEGISWGDSSRDREADSEGKIIQPAVEDPA